MWKTILRPQLICLLAATVLLGGCESMVLKVTDTEGCIRTYDIIEGKYSSSCNPDASATPTEGADLVLRLHGSNTIGMELVPALVQSFLAQEGASDIRRMEIKPQESRIEGKQGENVLAVEVHAHGSGSAFRDMKTVACDIGMSSRKIKEEEAGMLSHLGDMASPSGEHILALDGLAIIVHRENPVSDLDKAEIAKIFSGQITDWQEVGGKSGPIHIHARDDKSGIYDTFARLVLKPFGANLTDNAKQYGINTELSKNVAADPQGIGFSSLAYVGEARALAISDGATPIIPNQLTVKSGDYPLSYPLYLYVPPHSANSHLQRFMEFALSARGQEIVDKVGFAGVTVNTPTPTSDNATSAQKKKVAQDYQRTIASAKKLPIVFSFKQGSHSLDAQGQEALERLIEYIKAKPGKILLLGFTDSSGDYNANLSVSKRRAQLVADELKNQGILVDVVKGFGEEAPIASNDSAEGRNKNRRVEVWVK